MATHITSRQGSSKGARRPARFKAIVFGPDLQEEAFVTATTNGPMTRWDTGETLHPYVVVPVAPRGSVVFADTAPPALGTEDCPHLPGPAAFPLYASETPIAVYTMEETTEAFRFTPVLDHALVAPFPHASGAFSFKDPPTLKHIRALIREEVNSACDAAEADQSMSMADSGSDGEGDTDDSGTDADDGGEEEGDSGTDADEEDSGADDEEEEDEEEEDVFGIEDEDEEGYDEGQSRLEEVLLIGDDDDNV